MALFKCMCVFLVSLLLAITFTNAQEEASQQKLPSFPCIPGQPRPPWLPPCPSPPAECYTSLSGLMPCADFLTHIGMPPVPPTSACCDGLRSLVTDAPICLCHIVNGDINKLLPTPMIPVRMVALPRLCVVPFPRATLHQCIRGHVPPMDPPPSTPPEASPQESPSTPPAASPPESPPTPPTSSPPSTPPTASPPESPPTPPAAAPPEPPAASPPEPPSTPPPESPSTPPPTPAAAALESPSDPPTATPPESPTDPPPTPAATPPATPSPSS